MVSKHLPVFSSESFTKYTRRGRDLPASVTKGQAWITLDLKQSLLRLDPGVSPGFFGMRNEHQTCLAEVWGEKDLGLLRIIWYTIPEWRPASLIRSFHKQAVTKNKVALIDFLEPHQLALSLAGGGKLAHQIRMLSESRKDFIEIKVDMRNVHNEVSRAAVIEALKKEPSLRHMASHTSLEVKGKLFGRGRRRSQSRRPRCKWLVLCCLAT